MTFLDTNVLIYAFESGSPYQQWAKGLIVDHVSGDGAIVNPIVIGELCVGDPKPDSVADRVRSWGIEIVSLPAASAAICAKAFVRYRTRLQRQSGKAISAVPLPDFFIGAHAMVLGARLATADMSRYRTYFPKLELTGPEAG